VKKEQLDQDLEYEFPYHYVPGFRRDFTQIYEWRWSKNYTSAIEFLISQISKERNIGRLFDVGCGDGRLARELQEEFGSIDVVGIDYSERAIGLAKAMSPDVKFFHLDIMEKDFHLKCDAVTLVEVFEHIPVELCANFAISVCNLLEKDALLFLTVPHQNVEVSYKHFQHFNLEKLKFYFGEYFNFEDIKYIQKNPLYMKIISKLLSNRLYIIKSSALNNAFYYIYKKYCFNASEAQCERIYLKLRKK